MVYTLGLDGGLDGGLVSDEDEGRLYIQLVLSL